MAKVHIQCLKTVFFLSTKELRYYNEPTEFLFVILFLGLATEAHLPTVNEKRR